MLASAIVAQAVKEWRGSYSEKRWNNKGMYRKCAKCGRIFRSPSPDENMMYCGKTCWEQARQEIAIFFESGWFEELSEMVGVHADVTRKYLDGAAMPDAWKPVDIESV